MPATTANRSSHRGSMNFTNPTAGGRIQAQAEPWDQVSVRVTRDCAGHQATNQGCALDLGDGRCDRPVLAVAAGTVTFRDVVQGILRIDHGGGWQSDYAHMSPLLVTVGTKVTQGQQIGEISDAHSTTVMNFSGCHLHFGILLNGAEQDPWPYMNQGGDVNLKGTWIGWVQNRTLHLTHGAPLVEDPTAMPYTNLAAFPVNQAFTPSVEVRGNSLLGSDHWYGGWITGTPPVFGYCPVAACGPLVPIEAGGLTQAQLDKAVGDAIKPLNDKIAGAKAALG